MYLYIYLYINNLINKDRLCGSGDMLADRLTDRQTHGRAHYNTSPPLPRSTTAQ